MGRNSIAVRFGKNLARCRKLADLSQEELSVMASLHRTEISQLERGLRLSPHRHDGQAGRFSRNLDR